MPTVDSSYIYIPELGARFRRYHNGTSADLNTLGSIDFWKNLIRKLRTQSAVSPNIPKKVLPLDLFQGLSFEIYDSTYLVSGNNNPADPANSTLRLDSRGLTKDGTFSTIGISVVLGSGNLEGSVYLSEIASRQFGQYYGIRSGLLGTALVKKTIHNNLFSGVTNFSWVDYRNTNTSRALEDGATGAPLSDAHQFAEDYKYLFGVDNPAARLKFTPLLSSPGSVNPADAVTDIQSHPKLITLLACCYSVQRYLRFKTYTNITLQDDHITWLNTTLADDTNNGVYQAITNELVWYEWDAVNSKWYVNGSDGDLFRENRTATPPSSTPV